MLADAAKYKCRACRSTHCCCVQILLVSIVYSHHAGMLPAKPRQDRAVFRGAGRAGRRGDGAGRARAGQDRAGHCAAIVEQPGRFVLVPVWRRFYKKRWRILYKTISFTPLFASRCETCNPRIVISPYTCHILQGTVSPAAMQA